MGKPFYLTTTLPYVNAEPHIGFALEVVQADIIARYHQLAGDEVFFNTGTDEHGIKVYRKASEVGKSPKEYVDEYAEKFRNLKSILGLSDDIHFIRTTDRNHIQATQEFWKRCADNGFIDKKLYKTKYCIGCELEKTDSELEGGKCTIHPHLPIEISEEENYFFKFSAFQGTLRTLYKEHPDFVVPDFRFNEIKAFVDRGLEDFSISRLKEKMPWGVPVPGDEKHVMYVWFDALVNYISTLGWPGNIQDFEKFWGTKDAPNAIQFAGKDNLRQQSAMWQAMLMATGLPTSKQIVIHGFITSGGQKMSKSVGNVIDPLKIVEEYGTEALRFYLARHVSSFEDSDFTLEKFKESYNADLANGLGNFASRVLKMVEMVKSSGEPLALGPNLANTSTSEKYQNFLETYNFNKATELVWEQIAFGDGVIQEKKPFELLNTDKGKAVGILADLVQRLWRVSVMLEPFMPETSKKIQDAIRENKKPDNLFPRK